MAHERFRVKPDASVQTTLLGIEKAIVRARRPWSKLSLDDQIALGVLLGHQYVRGLGWEWATFVDADYSAEVVADKARGIMNRPIHWVHLLITEPRRELAIVLNFNMMEAGNFPPLDPSKPQFFE